MVGPRQYQEGGKGDGRGRGGPPGSRRLSGYGRQDVDGQNHPFAKRGACLWINRQIVEAAESGNLRRLISVIEAHLMEMNLVNLSTSAHRLAKLMARTGSMHHHSIWSPMLAMTTNSFRGLTGSEQALPQTLSNIAWSLGAMRLMDLPLLQVMLPLAAANVTAFKPCELSALLWAVAKLGAADAVPAPVKVLFREAAPHISAHVCDFEFRSLATIMWAYATAKQYASKVFRIIAAEMCRTIQTANSQEIANAAWAFATLNQRQEKLMQALAGVALERIGEFKAQEVSNMLWGFATNDFFDEAIFERALLCVQHMDLQAQHFANILWACARVGPCHPITRAASLALLPRCSWLLNTFKPQEVSSTMLAVGKLFGHNDDGNDAQAWTKATPLPATPHPHVLHFVSAAEPCVKRLVGDLSEQSLANIVTACHMLGIGSRGNLLAMLEQEALRRAPSLAPCGLIVLLKAFLCCSSCGRFAVRILARQLVCNFGAIQPNNVKMLARVYVKSQQLAPGWQATRDALYDWCLELSVAPEEWEVNVGETAHRSAPWAAHRTASGAGKAGDSDDTNQGFQPTARFYELLPPTVAERMPCATHRGEVFNTCETAKPPEVGTDPIAVGVGGCSVAVLHEALDWSEESSDDTPANVGVHGSTSGFASSSPRSCKVGPSPHIANGKIITPSVAGQNLAAAVQIPASHLRKEKPHPRAVGGGGVAVLEEHSFKGDEETATCADVQLLPVVATADSSSESDTAHGTDRISLGRRALLEVDSSAYIVKNTFLETAEEDSEMVKRRLWASTFNSERPQSRAPVLARDWRKLLRGSFFDIGDSDGDAETPESDSPRCTSPKTPSGTSLSAALPFSRRACRDQFS